MLMTKWIQIKKWVLNIAVLVFFMFVMFEARTLFHEVVPAKAAQVQELGLPSTPEDVVKRDSIPSSVNPDSVPSIDVADLRTQLKSAEPPLLLDVREPSEWEIASIDGSVKISLGSLADKYSELPKDKTIAIICHSGKRSARATAFLMEKGYYKVYSVDGGINAWAERIDNNMRTY